MSLVLPRRLFLKGAASLFAAPALIKADSLMRVSNIDHLLYPVRGLLVYEIYSDKIFVRVDRANFQLDMHPKAAYPVSEKIVRKLFTKDQLDAMLISPINNPPERWQRNISKPYDTTEWKNKGIEIPAY